MFFARMINDKQFHRSANSYVIRQNIQLRKLVQRAHGQSKASKRANEKQTERLMQMVINWMN